VRRLRALIALFAVASLVFTGQAAASRGRDPSTYKVRRGDTLSAVAVRFHTTVAVLAAVNNLPDANHIREGQVLRLAKPGIQLAASTKPVPASGLSSTRVVLNGNGTSSYQVVRGDTLAGIAQRYHTTVRALRDLNHLKAKHVLRVGEVLTVPGGSWKCPVAGATHFDYSDDWGAPRERGTRHMGNDIFARRGTPVVAPVAGRLRRVTGKIGGNAWYLYGVDGVTYYGAHLDKYAAKPGPVAQGAQIGVVGNTGDAAGGPPHLHFEVHPGGVAVDPFPTLTRWCW
jgi:murein DD-endopeptidase MepM/ murein hydrolase activator NlpD